MTLTLGIQKSCSATSSSVMKHLSSIENNQWCGCSKKNISGISLTQELYESQSPDLQGKRMAQSVYALNTWSRTRMPSQIWKRHFLPLHGLSGSLCWISNLGIDWSRWRSLISRKMHLSPHLYSGNSIECPTGSQICCGERHGGYKPEEGLGVYWQSNHFFIILERT